MPGSGMSGTANVNEPSLLIVNGGSSSIKFALYEAAESCQRQLAGKIDRIALSGTTFTVNGNVVNDGGIADGAEPKEAINALLDWLEKQGHLASVTAVGHRVVHGMRHSQPELISEKVLDELRNLTAYDPDHLPGELELIEAVQKRYPKLPQVACFDTMFHRTMPPVAKLVAIPRRYQKLGVERYGFHGLSYSYILQELASLDAAAAKGRVIVAHLGNGASLAAVLNGKSIDTSMGFTPTSGLVMSTRCGDIDPDLAFFLARKEKMTPEQFHDMVNHKSGLLGVSEISSDLRDLLAQEKSDHRAKEAVELFCYQVKKWIGSFSAALCGLDTLIFTGGIGENLAPIRARVCEGLAFLGIELSQQANDNDSAIISTAASNVTVRIIATNEEVMIARLMHNVLD
jgi:acetate kinase